MKNIPFHRTNKAITQLNVEFSQMSNEALSSVNTLMHVHNKIFPNKSEPSMTSVDKSSLSNTVSMNSISNNNKIFQMMTSVTTNSFNIITKVIQSTTNSKRGIRGNTKRFYTSKYCWTHEAYYHSRKEGKNKKLSYFYKQIS